jgi:hypothetical protein
LLELKPGTRIVSHDFSMDEWKPDAYARVKSKEKYGGAGGESEVYFWVVPAKVAGAWRWELTSGGKGAKPQAYTANLTQTFQMVSGTVAVNGRSVPVQNARMSGDELSFSFTADLGAGPVRHEFKGKSDGTSLHGSAVLTGSRSQGRYDWSAERSAGQ